MTQVPLSQLNGVYDGQFLKTHLVDFYKFFKSLFSQNSNTRTKVQTVHSPIDVSPELRKLMDLYNCTDPDDLICALVNKEMLGDELTEEENKVLNLPEYELLKDFAYFSYTIHRERKEQRSIAVKRLVDRNARVEEENEFDELVDYTLRVFSRFYIDYPEQCLERIRELFPTMAPFIIREVTERDCVLPIPLGFNEQKAYDEFLFYVSSQMIEQYPIVAVRNQQIRKEFRLIGGSLINFIENEVKTPDK